VLALLIDDHTLFRAGLELLLKQADKDIEVLHAGAYEDALPFADQAIDLIFLDYYLPGLEGLAALEAVRGTFDAPVIMLSGEEAPWVIRQTIDHGAAGYLPKSSTPDGLSAALHTIVSGGIFLPRDAIERERDSRSSGVREGLDGLSDRQKQVLAKAIRGKANKVIAREMNIAEGTVKAHLSAAYRELGVHNRTEAVYLSAELGLKPLRDRA
jgi:DNA-binding NarL/FixJ family response regulator